MFKHKCVFIEMVGQGYYDNYNCSATIRKCCHCEKTEKERICKYKDDVTNCPLKYCVKDDTKQ